VLKRVNFVMKNGTVIRRQAPPGAAAR
jgi:hypothetical protein